MSIVISTAVGNVGLKELYEGYEAGLDPTRGPYLVKYYLPDLWSHAFHAADALVGLGRTPIGHVCPEAPGLVCTAARVVPDAPYDCRDGGRPQFNLGKIAATYGILSWDALPTDDPDQSFPNEANPGEPLLYMEQSIDWDTEIIKLPNTAYRFESSGGTVDQPVMRSIGVAQFVLVRRWQSQLPYVNVTSYQNKLNASTFLGQPKGQIMFRKCGSRRQWTTDGTTSQECTYIFKWREYDHNMCHLPDRFGFDFIRDPTGAYPYQYADLSPLLA